MRIFKAACAARAYAALDQLWDDEMNRYTIENSRNGAILGTFQADSPHEALEAMARDAGYPDFAFACHAMPLLPGDLVVREAARDAVDALH